MGEHVTVRRRPDLPIRAGHGFFIKNEYITDKDLQSLLGYSDGIYEQHSKYSSLSSYEDHKDLHERIHSQPECCTQNDAICNSCKESKSLDLYCKQYPFTKGCEGENVVLFENEVCYEYCVRGTKINYPDKCNEGLTCAPLSVSLSDGGGCGVEAYTCQNKQSFLSDTVEIHKEEITDHMITHKVIGDEWIDDEIHALMEEMTICEKIKYKIDLQPDKCDLQHKYLYKKKGCCEESKVTDSPVFYIVIGAGACCLFMTCAAVAGCAEMQRRKANRLERRMKRLLTVNNGSDVMESFWERKRMNEQVRFKREARYNELQTELYNQTLRSPLIYNEIL